MYGKTVVLIFGVFNPVTSAHINMGYLAEKTYPQAEVIYVPTKLSYLNKDKKLSAFDIMPEADRIRLLAESINDFASISACEIDGHVSGKTFDTVQYFRNLYDRVIICMGADKLCELDTWYKGEELVANNRFLIVKRNGTRGKLPESMKKYANNFTYVAGAYQEISSSKVRIAAHEGIVNSIKEYVPQCVYDYLRKHPEVYKYKNGSLLS